MRYKVKELNILKLVQYLTKKGQNVVSNNNNKDKSRIYKK
jgi:hypothetical protein